MKSLAQIRKTSEDVLLENTDNTDIKKLTTLVRSGLFDPNKLMLLKRALAKENMKMTKAERQVLLDLLDKLLNLVTNDRQMFGRTRQIVREEAEDGEFEDIPINEVSALPAVGERGIGPGALARSIANANRGNRGNVKVGVDTNQIPALIVLKRRAIRVFPDGQKVALYWADRINKYISVPFQSIGISEDLDEEQELNEILPLVALGTLAVRAAPVVARAAGAGYRAFRASRAARAASKLGSKGGKSGFGKGVAAGAVGSSAVNGDGDKSPAEKTAAEKSAAEKSAARSLKKDGPAFGGTKIKAYSAVRAFKDKQAGKKQEYLDSLYDAKDEKPKTKKDDISEQYIMQAARFYNLNINSTSASKIFATYNSLNENNKVVFQEMINRNKDSFTEVLNFTLKN